MPPSYCAIRGTHLIDTKAPKLMMLKLITIIITPRDMRGWWVFQGKTEEFSLFKNNNNKAGRIFRL